MFHLQKHLFEQVVGYSVGLVIINSIDKKLSPFSANKKLS